MKCPYCGYEASATAKVCGQCGTWLVAKKDAQPAMQPATPGVAPAPPSVHKPRRGPKKGLLLGVGLLAGSLLFVVLIINPFSGSPLTSTTAPGQMPGESSVSQANEKQPGEESVIFYDSFEDPSSGFSIFGEPSSYDVGYADNAFRIAFDESMGFQASWSPDDYRDAVVETSIDVPQGVDVGAGLQLRASPDNWYLLFIFPNSKEYSISKVVNGQNTELVERRFSDAIQPYFTEGRALFLMRVRMLADKLTLEFGEIEQDENFVVVDQITDSDLS